ncbi:uncharacterized protein LOC127870315 isoform X2 [Dreissena polymorpha]|uniref:Uncharacterized protein n=1 Tax=Dreissena polymorpha TaxID=45954 RepID=A0A9D4RHS9_DREPO|nr:uncharacterized protein LOC127870315 isoform X2 [Dreissena polymorpha]KAH3868033.1 hypothetical protein DPMN_031170 [Dreissena polymorpha]
MQLNTTFWKYRNVCGSVMEKRIKAVVFTFLIVIYQVKVVNSSSEKSSSSKSTIATTNVPAETHTEVIDRSTTVYSANTTTKPKDKTTEMRWHLDIIGPCIGGLLLLDIVLILAVCYTKRRKSCEGKQTAMDIGTDATCLRIIHEETEAKQSTGSMYANFDECQQSTDEIYVNDDSVRCAPSVDYSNVQVVSHEIQSYNEAADPSMIENFENPFYDVDNLEKNDHANGNQNLVSGQTLSDEHGHQAQSYLYSVVNKPRRN